MVHLLPTNKGSDRLRIVASSQRESAIMCCANATGTKEDAAPANVGRPVRTPSLVRIEVVSKHSLKLYVNLDAVLHGQKNASNLQAGQGAGEVGKKTAMRRAWWAPENLGEVCRRSLEKRIADQSAQVRALGQRNSSGTSLLDLSADGLGCLASRLSPTEARTLACVSRTTLELLRESAPIVLSGWKLPTGAACRRVEASGLWRLGEQAFTLCLGDSASMLQGISLCGSLHTLAFVYCPRLETLETLAECRHLRSLRLVSCPKLEDVSALRECTRLASVTFSTCTAIRDLSPLAHSPSLEKLALLYSSSICTTTMLSPLASSPSLRKLVLSSDAADRDLARQHENRLVNELQQLSRGKLSVEWEQRRLRPPGAKGLYLRRRGEAWGWVRTTADDNADEL
jgi:hypothetical protein